MQLNIVDFPREEVFSPQNCKMDGRQWTRYFISKKYKCGDKELRKGREKASRISVMNPLGILEAEVTLRGGGI